MDSFRHNPYIGSFHGVPYSLTGQPSLVMAQSKTNPMIGLFRHSPAINHNRRGLKTVICDDNHGNVPIVSQLRVNREVKSSQPERNFVTSLKQIPVSVFSASLAGTPSVSEAAENTPSVVETQKDEDAPMCSICLESYTDGDEIVTLACSHCFHSNCANKWFYQDCLNDATKSCNGFRCPQCRQDHIALSEVGSSHASDDEGIPSRSFLQVGQSMLRDGGYDFLSDVGSEHNSSTVLTPGRTNRAAILSSPSPDPTRIMTTVQGDQRNNISNNNSNGQAVILPKPTLLSTGLGLPIPPSPLAVAAACSNVGTRLEWSAYSDCGVPFHK